MEWFREQPRLCLIGEIDKEKTCDGTIVCKDSFRATTVCGDPFAELLDASGLKASIIEWTSLAFSATSSKKLVYR